MAQEKAAGTLDGVHGGGALDQRRCPDYRPKPAETQALRRACRLPESPDGICAMPVTCPCDGPRIIRQIADLAERGRKAIAIAAERLNLPERAVREIVAVELEFRRSATPEQRARAAA